MTDTTSRPATPILDRVASPADLKALMPWLQWAFDMQKASLKQAA